MDHSRSGLALPATGRRSPLRGVGGAALLAGAGLPRPSACGGRTLISPRNSAPPPSGWRWGIGNELTDALLASPAGIIAAEDPDRLSTYAVRGEDPDDARTGLHTQVTGFNLHTGSPARRIAVSEYGVGANTSQHALNPPKPASTFVRDMFDFASDGPQRGRPGEHPEPSHHQPSLGPANRCHHRTEGLLQRERGHRHSQRHPLGTLTSGDRVFRWATYTDSVVWTLG
jgi:hypothetical protein